MNKLRQVLGLYSKGKARFSLAISSAFRQKKGLLSKTIVIVGGINETYLVFVYH